MSQPNETKKYQAAALSWVGFLIVLAAVLLVVVQVIFPLVVDRILATVGSESEERVHLVKLLSLLSLWIGCVAIFSILFSYVPVFNRAMRWFIAINKDTFWK